MKKSDISDIKLGGKGFAKTWWQERRAITAHGCGMGKALDAWAKDCPNPPEKITDPSAQEKARKAAEAVMAAALKAKKKAGKLAKDTALACEKYHEVAQDYLGRIGGDADTGRELLEAIENARPRIQLIGRQIDETGKAFATVEGKAGKIAQAASKLSGSGKDGLGDLEKALKELNDECQSLSKKTDRELSLFFRLGTPVEDAAKKMGGTSHVAALKEFRKLIEDTNRRYEGLRSALTSCQQAIQETGRVLDGTANDEEKLRKELENTLHFIWGNPSGSPEGLSAQIQKYVERMSKISSVDPTSLPKEKIDEIREAMRITHSGVMRLEANTANLVRAVKRASDLARRLPPDGKTDKQIKEAAMALQIVSQMKANFEKERKKAQEVFGAIA